LLADALRHKALRPEMVHLGSEWIGGVGQMAALGTTRIAGVSAF